jgi:hypothetical protein
MHSCTCEKSAATSRPRNTIEDRVQLDGLPPRETPRFPADLREWASPWQIRTWIYEEIGRLDRDNSILGQDPQRQQLSQRRAMVCLLCFAYATQQFSSQQIAEASWSNAVLREICDGHAPFAHEVRNFRRQHRPVLEAALAGVFLQALASRHHLDPSLLTPEIERDLREQAVNRLEIAWQMDIDDEE